jgi:hypothetical protein
MLPLIAEVRILEFKENVDSADVLDTPLINVTIHPLKNWIIRS